jgi:acyl-CoA synthetase (NDP forming)
VLRGNRVAILTSTGGAGTLVSATSLGVHGFDTPAPDAPTAEALRALQTGSDAVLDRNPIDVTLAGLQPDLLRGAIRPCWPAPATTRSRSSSARPAWPMPELMAGAIQDCLPLSDKPVMAYVSPHAPEVGALLTQRGVPAFAAAESCTVALGGMLAGQPSWQAPDEPRARCRPVAVDDVAPGSLDEAQAKQLFARFGVPCAGEIIVTTPAEAEAAARKLGGRVVLKILSSQITHKSDVGGVAVGLTR